MIIGSLWNCYWCWSYSNAPEAPLKISPQQNYFTCSVIFKLFLASGERVEFEGKERNTLRDLSSPGKKF